MKQTQRKIITIEKPLRELKRSSHDIDDEETINILKNYYIPNQERNNIDYMISLLNKKTTSYKQQDINKQKFDPESFITLDEVIDKLLSSNLECYYCREKTKIFYTHSRQPNQWTLERIDNSIGHTCSNTVIACLSCNLQRRDKNSNHFKFAKQLVIKKI
jgi:hypothetical protein